MRSQYWARVRKADQLLGQSHKRSTFFRTIHRIGQILAWGCLLVSVLILPLWIRSYSVMDFVGREWCDVRLEKPWQISRGVWSGKGGIGYLDFYDEYPPGVDLVRREKNVLVDMDGTLRWQVMRQYVHYPYETSARRNPQFVNVRFSFVVPPPWSLDGSQLRARRLWAVVVPYWSIFLVFAVWPAMYFGPWIWSVVKILRRLREGQCYRCGYDVRATPDQCPECGLRYPNGYTKGTDYGTGHSKAESGMV